MPDWSQFLIYSLLKTGMIAQSSVCLQTCVLSLDPMLKNKQIWCHGVCCGCGRRHSLANQPCLLGEFQTSEGIQSWKKKKWPCPASEEWCQVILWPPHRSEYTRHTFTGAHTGLSSVGEHLPSTCGTLHSIPRTSRKDKEVETPKLWTGIGRKSSESSSQGAWEDTCSCWRELTDVSTHHVDGIQILTTGTLVTEAASRIGVLLISVVTTTSLKTKLTMLDEIEIHASLVKQFHYQSLPCRCIYTCIFFTCICLLVYV